MGGSLEAGKTTIVEWVNELSDIKNILDIGAGAGTYYNLFVNQYQLLKESNWIAVEAWTPSIAEYGLKQKYQTVLNEDIRSLDWSLIPDLDVVFMGDVLEHMTKEEAIVVVDNVMSKSRYGIISIPIKHWPQGAVNRNPFEVHVKDDWSMQEVNETFSKYITKEAKVSKQIGVFLLSK